MLEAIILAGGLGTRLQKVISDIPKSMAPVNGRPFLEYLIAYLVKQGVGRVVLSVGHMHEIIERHFGSRFMGIEVDYAVESEPLGTGGGIRLAMWKTTSADPFVLNGDTMFHVDLQVMRTRHIEKRSDITIALRKTNDTARYGLVKTGRTGRITGFLEKDSGARSGMINGGVYIIKKQFLMDPSFRGRFSIEKDCFEKYYDTVHMYGFNSEGYFRDIGIPEDYQLAQHEFTRFKY